MPPVYSHSRLSSFENCPKQFHFRYVERIRVDTESVEAFVGKLVHAVIEKLLGVVDRGQIPSLAAVLKRYHVWWDERYDAARIRIVRAENPPEHYRGAGERCLENFYRRHYPFDDGESVGVEERIAFRLDDAGRYRIQGFVDRIVRARDGALEVHDYKTGARVPPKPVLDRDRQLAFYQIGVAERFGHDGEIRLVWHYLLRNQIRRSQRTRDQLEQLRAETIELIGRIESEQAFEARTGPLCRWCEYVDGCRAGAASVGRPAPVAETLADAVGEPVAEANASLPSPDPAPPPTGRIDPGFTPGPHDQLPLFG